MAKDLSTITRKWISGDELDILAPFIEARNWMPLNKPLTRARVAFDQEGRPVGFYLIKLLPHPEPIFVDPEWRGTGLAEDLAQDIHDILADTPAGGVWFTAENPMTAKMAEDHGLVLVGHPVYTNGGSNGR